MQYPADATRLQHQVSERERSEASAQAEQSNGQSQSTADARRAKATGRRGRRGVARDPPGVAKTRRFPTEHALAQAIDRRGPDSICSFLLALLRTPELSAAVALWPKLSGPRRSMAGRRWRNGGSAARVVAGRGGCREPSPDPSRGSSGPVTTLATRAPRHPRRPSPRSSS